MLVAHFAHIRRANVTLDGYNSHDKRASNLSKAGELDITNIHEVELHRKLHSLCRTLKVLRFNCVEVLGGEGGVI